MPQPRDKLSQTKLESNTSILLWLYRHSRLIKQFRGNVPSLGTTIAGRNFDRKTKKRSSHRKCSVKKGSLRNFAKFTGKLLRQNLLFNKVADLLLPSYRNQSIDLHSNTVDWFLYEGNRPATSLKRRLWRRCFPVNFVKFLRTPFLQNTSRRLLLQKQK